MTELAATIARGDYRFGPVTPTRALVEGKLRALYRAQPQKTLTQLIETLWLQFGPYMRVVYGRVSSAKLNDSHQQAIRAIEAGDGESLRKAIAEDIADGMGLLGRTGLTASGALSA